MRNNTEMLNNLGNFINRLEALKMLLFGSSFNMTQNMQNIAHERVFNSCCTFMFQRSGIFEQQLQ